MERYYLGSVVRYQHERSTTQVLTDADILLGENYPYPIVDLKASRETALLEYKRLTGRI